MRLHRRGPAIIVALMVASTLSALLPSSAMARTPTCDGKKATIVGTAKADRIKGTTRADVIVSLDGNDTIQGLRGKDRICGGAGNDVMLGGKGDDLLSGSRGNDTASFAKSAAGVTANLGTKIASTSASSPSTAGTASGEGTDALIGVENLTGSSGADTLSGDDAVNMLIGGSGDDTIVAAPGDDTLLGGDGDDTLEGDEGTDTIDGGPGDDTCIDEVGDCDNEAPRLVDFDFSPKTIDTSAGPQEITVTAHITDDLAGVSGSSQVRFLSPSGQSGQFIDAVFDASGLVSGTALDGVYEDTITLPHFSEQGTWNLQRFLMVDTVSNVRDLFKADLEASGLPTSFDQEGAGDTDAPRLVEFDFSPKTVDASAGPQQITVTARITDNLAGLSDGSVRFQGSSGHSGQLADAMFGAATRVSGTALDGVYEDTITVRQYAEQGTWSVEYVILHDAVANLRFRSTADVDADGFPTSFEQEGVGDNTAPQLVDFDFTPKTIDTSGGPQEIVVTAHITDDLAGAGGMFVRFTSPSGQIADASMGQAQMVSGTALDAIFEATAPVPQFSEHGTWTITWAYITDKAGNSADLDLAAFTAAGFPASFQNGP